MAKESEVRVMSGWNPWHGCHRYSPGCDRCYVYRADARHGRDSTAVTRTGQFALPLKRDRRGAYTLRPDGDYVYTCFSSDFLVEEADAWRAEAWDMIRTRQDLHFFFITKRITRLSACLPPDWGDGWDNVTVGCTCENQLCADRRLPVFLSLPLHHRHIVCEPLLTPIDLSLFLTGGIEQVTAGGESGEGARVCDDAWIRSLREQCLRAGVSFLFHQTGANYRRDGRIYPIPRARQHEQARRSGYSFVKTAEQKGEQHG